MLLFIIISKDIEDVNIKCKLRKFMFKKCHHVHRHRIFYKNATKPTGNQPLSNFLTIPSVIAMN